MATQFSQIFWGLLLVILDISINGFDLLVDGVGYLIAAAGCFGLSSLSSRFVGAGTLCLVLAALWLIGFVVPGDIATAQGLVTNVVDCAMMWQLLGGIRKFALSRQREDLAKQAGDRRVAYVVITAIISLILFAMRGSPNAVLLAVILAVAMLILLVMILHLIHRVKVELAT
ncbi:MAG TPA: hypothetical protein IGS53_02570 [Leptolyngbyaceae cyanobacterium M33_DOE_097]|uniref:Uncharacterized protein n=1 Tax=Oscillatoriales cyanobacterium SpSt-418 TaxID=2282169 RepID=A0A7C3PEF7_9CYAN|nr:hypothetical protein [Leptolyngbyaceae cyanobacterium M33_DOE_097]